MACGGDSPAGRRWEGAVPAAREAARDLGLIVPLAATRWCAWPAARGCLVVGGGGPSSPVALETEGAAATAVE